MVKIWLIRLFLTFTVDTTDFSVLARLSAKNLPAPIRNHVYGCRYTGLFAAEFRQSLPGFGQRTGRHGFGSATPRSAADLCEDTFFQIREEVSKSTAKETDQVNAVYCKSLFVNKNDTTTGL